MFHFREDAYESTDQMKVYYYAWIPEKIKGVFQLAHGMGEKGMRYEETARFFCSQGFAVYINDHRGHGRTADGEYGYMGSGDVFLKMVRDMKSLHDIIRAEHPTTKIFLLGHSMGSLLALRYAQVYGKSIDALLLSGTGGVDQVKGAMLGRIMARMICILHDERTPAVAISRLNNRLFNLKIKAPKTNSDWICSDPKVVEEFIQAADLGFVFSASAYYHMFNGMRENFLPVNMSYLPKELPILMFSGREDPLGNYGKGVQQLYEYMRDQLGIREIDLYLYEGRHEMLNEFLKERVREDILRWIFEHPLAQD